MERISQKKIPGNKPLLHDCQLRSSLAGPPVVFTKERRCEAISKALTSEQVYQCLRDRTPKIQAIPPRWTHSEPHHTPSICSHGVHCLFACRNGRTHLAAMAAYAEANRTSSFCSESRSSFHVFPKTRLLTRTISLSIDSPCVPRNTNRQHHNAPHNAAKLGTVPPNPQFSCPT